MKSFLFALLLALAATAFAAPVFAWPTIDVTSSEVVSIDPPRIRTTFVVGSLGYEPGCSRQYLEVTPLDTQTLHIFECGAPPGWNCGEALPAGSGTVYFANPNNAAGLTFSIVTEQREPCVRFYFPDPVLARSPGGSLNYDCVAEGCLVLDAPVPTRHASWGSVKSLYR